VRSGCVVSEPVGTDLADGTPQSGHTLSG
jgi:hypothetical protein